VLRHAHREDPGAVGKVALGHPPFHIKPRKRTALDWMAVAAEEHGREILEVYLQAMRGGDLRAAEALMSRIYGKPELDGAAPRLDDEKGKMA
jgi:hypothetical protein